ncbi:MAG: CBS domain-containing protein [Fibrobacterota bacterium]
MSDTKFNPTESLVVRELITRLRVSNVMSTQIHSVFPTESLRNIQHLMKEKQVSGVPVIDEAWHLLGIITVDDIIAALDKNYIEEPARDHMTTDVISLNDNYPLAVAISHFEKYSFRRYPVINDKNKLVGLITGRDILSSLLFEINNEVDKLEELLPERRVTSTEFFYKKFHIEKRDMKTAGKASSEVKKFCKRSNFSRKFTRRVGVAAFELEINIVVHSHGGSITIMRENDFIKIIAKDKGPGIGDLNKAMEEGYSTANEWVRSYGFGAGMGLPNIRRVSDSFHITSSEKGTNVTVTFNID